MADSKKRKERSGGDGDNRQLKKSKGGSGGKWQTPHQQAKIASFEAATIKIGDSGIWATCARNQERRAAAELKSMLEECAERFYGLKFGSAANGNEEEEDDIEAAIQKEIASMDQKQESGVPSFTVVSLDILCVMFVKTPPSIDPVDFVHRICKEILSTPKIRKLRYINRLTPTTLIGKASEKGLEEVSRSTLSRHFALKSPENEKPDIVNDGQLPNEASNHESHHSYAIRPTIRNHTTLKRDAIIKSLASSIADSHKVDLTSPDKVILVDIYQTVCGMSVVGGDWEELKRYNLSALYPHDRPSKKVQTTSDVVVKTENVAVVVNGVDPTTG